MRSTNATESAICEPPKPRLTTWNSGKLSARLVQRRMLELPVKRIDPAGGGLVRSCASKAAISFSHFATSPAEGVGSLSAEAQPTSASVAASSVAPRTEVKQRRENLMGDVVPSAVRSKVQRCEVASK